MARAKQKSPKPAAATAAPKPSPAWWRWIMPAALVIAAAVLSCQQIDLSALDIGRHLKNGQIIVEGTAAQRAAVLHTNYYSYTAPGAPFINHHWLSGVVFFLVWKLVSFEGLTLFYAALTALVVLAAYFVALKESHWSIAAPVMALALTNIVWRTTPRPEIFTNLMIVVLYGILLAWYRGQLSTRWLWGLLPPLMLLWINLHIGFLFGFLLMGMFGLKLLAAPARLRAFVPVVAASVALCLVNPSGIFGLLQPFNIFNDYTYPVAELQSLAYIRSRQLWSWQYDLFLLLVAAAAGAAVWRWLARKRYATVRWPDLLLLNAVAVLAMVIVRNMPIFCILAVPILSGVIGDAIGSDAPAPTPARRRYLALAFCAAGLFFAVRQYNAQKPTAGLGLRAGVNGAADFLRDNNIQGPVWNAPELGSYLIFHRFDPAHPRATGVFSDMRPEAYPGAFFRDTYIPMRTDEEVWKRADAQYHFNVLVYSLEHGAYEIEQSILTRVRDPQWAPVFTDYYTLIFVRRTPQNAEVIAKHLIPREVFR